MLKTLGPVLQRAFGGIALALLLGGGARAEEVRPFLWAVAGEHNTVYLLGSVHVLHASDRALPPPAEAAYADAEVIVEELDPFLAQAQIFSAEVVALQFLPPGKSLAALIGAELNQQLLAAAKPVGLDPEYVDRMQPWYVATLLTSLRQMAAGYTAEDGVDMQIAQRARRDQKPLVGLETVAEQLGFFAAMSQQQQIEMLRESLDDAAAEQELQELTEAWRRGDLAALEASLMEGLEEMPELFERIVVQRNHAWLGRIEQMLADPEQDYLVVTGALHLVGPQGLVELLRERGYRMTRNQGTQ